MRMLQDFHLRERYTLLILALLHPGQIYKRYMDLLTCSVLICQIDPYSPFVFDHNLKKNNNASRCFLASMQVLGNHLSVILILYITANMTDIKLIRKQSWIYFPGDFNKLSSVIIHKRSRRLYNCKCQ